MNITLHLSDLDLDKIGLDSILLQLNTKFPFMSVPSNILLHFCTCHNNENINVASYSYYYINFIRAQYMSPDSNLIWCKGRHKRIKLNCPYIMS